MGNPFKDFGKRAKKAVANVSKIPAYQGRTQPLENEDRDYQKGAGQFKYTPYQQAGGNGKVPMTIEYGAKPDAKQPPAEKSKVPRERWVRNNSAQMQGPLESGQTPGLPPFIGPYAGNSQRVPSFLDPRTKRYTPGSKEEFQTWLSGEAFGADTRGEMPTFSGMTPTDLEIANVRRAQQGLPPISSSALQSVNQPGLDGRKAWSDAMSGMYEDASDRAARRNTVTTLGGIGRSMADAAENVYGALAANAKRYADPYADIERIRLNRGAPSDNLSQDDTIPAYSGGYPDGYGGGGYGGGGGGGYSPATRKWLQNMASWRI